MRDSSNTANAASNTAGTGADTVLAGPPALNQAQLVELPALASQAGTGPAVLAGHAALLDSVKVSLSVVVGAANTTLGDLMSLKELAVIKLDRQVDTPVDVVVNGNVVARGHLVVVDDNFGVRITEIAAAVQA